MSTCMPQTTRPPTESEMRRPMRRLASPTMDENTPMQYGMVLMEESWLWLRWKRALSAFEYTLNP